MIRLVNLTLHPVVVYDGEHPIATWPASGEFARLGETTAAAAALTTDKGEVPVIPLRYADSVEGLPIPCEGVAYIVSRVLAAAVDRQDLYFPFGEVRDDDGRIIGCRALGRFDHARGHDDA